MMKMSHTLLLVLIAVILCIAAILAVPSSVEPEAFSDQGELFFPAFTDPLECKELEVYAPDSDTGEVKVFNVRFEKGLWRIPSHHGYPADAKERMAAAAASLVGLRKDQIRSDRPEDQAKFKVEDPRDPAASLEGRGKRIIMKDGAGRTLADIIVGKEVEGHMDWAYLRKPESKRIYAVNLKGNKEGYAGQLLDDISTTFSEWIDTDLLHLKRWEVNRILIQNYSVDEEKGTVETKERLDLAKKDGNWTLADLAEEEQVAKSSVDEILDTLDDLTIAGVRPTPEPLTGLSLMTKGFFLDKEGNLYGNEGQMDVTTDKGVAYHLFFGEVLLGTGEAVTAGKDKKEGGEQGKDEKEETDTTENRYLFVRVSMDPDFEKEAKEKIAAAEAALKKKEEEEKAKEATESGKGEDKAAAGGEAEKKEGAEKTEEKEKKEKSKEEKEKEEWQKKLDDAKKQIDELNLRFKKWYYVITNDAFKKLRKTRKELVEPKPPDTSKIGEQPKEKKEPVKRSSGLSYIDLRTGSGDSAWDGDTVKVLYTGWLKDGTVFDQCLDKEHPFTVTLGEGKVIKGWEEGLRGMKAGGKRKLVIPPKLGYGEKGQGDKIPPNAYLIFDIEVLEVQKK